MKQPKIRFKRFSGEWEEKNIASIANLKAGKSINTSQEISYPSNGYYPCYGGNGLRGFVRDYTHDGIYNIIGRQGALCGNVKLVSGKFHATEHAVVVSPTTPLDPYFLYNLLTKANINQYATGVAQPGISVQNVNKSLFLVLPNFAEQRTVGMYFQHLDSLIQSTAKKIDSLKQVKAASLQSMFPQEGETTPRVRFKGFEGEWEIVPFAKVFSFVKNNSFTRDQLSVSEGEVKNVHYGDVLIKFGDIIDGKKDCLPYIIGLKQSNKLCQTALLRDGDIIIADAAEDNTVGKCSEMFNINNEYVLSGLHTIACRPLIIFALGYLGHYMNTDSYHNQLLPLIQGSKISSISKSAVLQTSILFPSYAEQQQIASYFTALDSQISLHSQRLEKLKQIKSACLDNMFV